jgi:dTDP-4-dehydrorhamnose reductase
MRIAVIGANGQLGADLLKALTNSTLFPLARRELDIGDFARTRKALAEIRPDVVINTAACTRVDDCEDEPATAFMVNAFAPRNVAQVCADIGSILVQISTDYVFGGEKRTPYTEEEPPKPLNVYGGSKLAGEYFVRFQRLGLRPDFGPTTSGEFAAKARRPAYSVLANERLRQLGLAEPRPWREAVEAYLKEKGYL